VEDNQSYKITLTHITVEYVVFYSSEHCPTRFTTKVETPVVAALAEEQLQKEDLQKEDLQVPPDCSLVDLLAFVEEVNQGSVGIHLGRTARRKINMLISVQFLG